MPLLRRIGNKSRIAGHILPQFPKHDLYIEPFFGAGGMFFNKPKAKYNILNDNDSEVFNLWQVVTKRKEDLKKAVYSMPVCEDLIKHWNVNQETDQVMKALRFLLLSNYGVLGNPNTLRLGVSNDSKILLDSIDQVQEKLFDIRICNSDFRDVIKKISFKYGIDIPRTFIYADPPYLGTANNYENSFTETDSIDLFDMLEGSGCKFAMSEFAHPFILSQAEERGLNVVNIIERQTLKNRNVEILVTNYQKNQLSIHFPESKKEPLAT